MSSVRAVIDAFDDLEIQTNRANNESASQAAKRAAEKVAPNIIEAIWLRILSENVPYDKQYEFDVGYMHPEADELLSISHKLWAASIHAVATPFVNNTRDSNVDTYVLGTIIEKNVSDVILVVIPKFIELQFKNHPRAILGLNKALNDLLRFVNINIDRDYLPVDRKPAIPDPATYKKLRKKVTADIKSNKK